MKIEVYTTTTPEKLWVKIKKYITEEKIKTWVFVKDVKGVEYLTQTPQKNCRNISGRILVTWKPLHNLEFGKSCNS